MSFFLFYDDGTDSGKVELEVFPSERESLACIEARLSQDPNRTLSSYALIEGSAKVLKALDSDGIAKIISI